MKKLHLEDLVVDSFVTSVRGLPRGTVAAHATDEVTVCWTYQAETCGTNCTGACTTDTSDTDQPHSRAGQSCNISCAPGQTDCGTCAPYASCDLQYGCGGTSRDMQPC